MNGIYGTVKPADIDIEKDVEMFYHYRPDISMESYDFESFKPLDVSCISPNYINDNSGEKVKISGLFNLKLPLNKFSSKGIYTIYIKPKEIDAVISNVASLAAYPSIRGVSFNISSNAELSPFRGENLLCGYRIEYMDDYGKEKTGEYTIITSSNMAEVLSYPLSNSSQKSLSYRYTSTGGHLFCTVTPSVSSSFRPNSSPFIGKSGQKVKIVNTKFNPILMEVEVVDHDFDTISTMIEGNQIRNLDKGLITTYNDRNEIYHQSEFFTLKDDYGKPLFDVKAKKKSPDTTDNIDNIIGNVE